MIVRRSKEGALTERVARMLLGPPIMSDADRGTQRYVEDISINLATGRCFDLEQEVGLTYIDLIRRFKKLENGQAENWLEQNVTKVEAPPLPAEYATERALIGMLAAQPELMAAIEEEVTVDYFGEGVHKQFFGAIADLPFVPDQPISMQALIDAAGGDPLAPVYPGYTLARYVAMIIAEAPMAPDAAHLARTLAAKIRSDANREGEVEDEFDLEPEPAPFISRMGLRMWADQDVPGPHYEYLVEDLIPERQVVVLMGESGTGKSFLTFSMAMALSRGVSFLGRRILKPVGVVWCAYEAAEGAGARMRAYRRHHGLKLEPLPFGALQHPFPLWPNEPNGEILINEIRGIERAYFGEFPLGAIVVDTYNAATPGASEIDSEVVSKIRSYFRRVVAETGAALIIVGHTNASGKHRGNEQLTNNVDTIIKVSFKTRMEGREVIQIKDDAGRDIRTMKVVKQREGRNGDEFDFVLRAVEDGTVNKFGAKRTSCVIEEVGMMAPDAPVRVAGRGKPMPHQEANIYRALIKALNDSGEPVPSVFRAQIAKSVRTVVLYKYWKEAFRASALDMNTTSVRQAMYRVGMKFSNLGVIGTHENYVWITGKAYSNEADKDGPQLPLQADPRQDAMMADD